MNRMWHRRLEIWGGALGALALMGVLPGWAASLPRQGPVSVEVLAEREEVRAGEAVWIGLRFAMEPEWHIYWTNPGAAGFPPSVTWQEVPGVTWEGLRFPVPKVFESGGMASYGYEKEAWLLARVQLATSVMGEVLLRGRVEWLACDPHSCVPGQADVEVRLRVGQGSGAARAEISQAVAALPQSVGWKMEATLDEGAHLLRLRMRPERELPGTESLMLFLEQPGVVDPAMHPAFRKEGEALLAEMPLAKDFAGLPEELSVLLASRDGSWGPPVVVSTGKGKGGKSGDAVVAGKEAEKGEGSAGEGWGSWLQQPAVVLLLAALMFLIGLNLLGVFEIGTSLTGAGGKLGGKEGPAGSFLSGGLATIVATPCTAPFMGSAIFYALGQPPAITLLIFTFLGLGMAAPYLILSRFPQLIDRLPRPGAWMETLKQGLAFPMFAVVIWLVWVLAFQVNQNGLLAALSGLLLLALGAWWFGRFATPSARGGVRWAARLGAGTLAVVALLLGLRASELRLPARTLDVEERIAQLQSQGKGVFVDFTAAWCLTCQANKAAMHSSKVQAALAEQNVEFLEVDWTQRDPQIHRVLQKYGREGVPLYLVFPSAPDAEPRVLPNLLTEDIIVEALRHPEAGSGGGEREAGFWGALLGAFLGGLILNLMPCVFPVISLKILGFVSQAGADPRRIWHHGLAFAAGVLSFFWLLALLLLGARAAI